MNPEMYWTQVLESPCCNARNPRGVFEDHAVKYLLASFVNFGRPVFSSNEGISLSNGHLSHAQSWQFRLDKFKNTNCFGVESILPFSLNRWWKLNDKNGDSVEGRLSMSMATTRDHTWPAEQGGYYFWYIGISTVCFPIVDYSICNTLWKWANSSFPARRPFM